MIKPLLARLCARRPKTDYSFDNVNSILVRPIPAIGDAVAYSAVFAQLRQIYPSAKIGIIALSRAKEVYKRYPGLDKIIESGLISALRERGKWQLFFDCESNFTTHNIIFDKILSPEYTICLEKKSKKYYDPDTVKNYDYYCVNDPKLHMKDWLRLTPLAPLIKSQARYCLTPPEQDEDPYNKRRQKPIILLCAEGSVRILPLPVLQTVLEALAKLPFSWRLLNTPRAGGYYEALKKIEGLDISIAPKTDFNGFLAGIYFADVIFSVDTAAVHIAGAFKKPLVALYPNKKENLTLMGPQVYKDVLLLIAEEENLDKNDLSKCKAEEIIPKTQKFLENYKK